MKRQLKWPLKEPKSKTQTSGFTEMNTENCVLPQQHKDIISSCTLRRTCSDISIIAFKKAHCKNDLSVLIITGTPTPEDLQDAWNEIIWEYSGLIRTDTTDNLQEISKEIGLLQHHIIYVENALSLLRLRHDLKMPASEEIIKGFISMGYYIDYGLSYPQQLQSIESQCKTQVFDLISLQDEYNRLQKTMDGKKQTEEEMDKNIVMLSKYMGFRIDQQITMMDEYAQVMNIYIREVTSNNKSN